MEQMHATGYPNEGYCHDLNTCKIFPLLVKAPSSPGPTLRYPSPSLFNQPLQIIRWGPFFSCGSPASSFPACNARVVFKTNENGTQETK